MSIIKRLISTSNDKLKYLLSASSCDAELTYPFVDIAVPSLDVAFIPLELSMELNDLCNGSFNDKKIVR